METGDVSAGSGTGIRVRRMGRAMWALAGAIAFLALSLMLTWHWRDRDAFAQHDVLFDTDTKSRLGCYADGWVGHGRNTIHPNLCNLVNPPIRALSTVLSPAPERLAMRQHLALWVSPLAAAATLFCLTMTAGRWGARRGQRLLLGLTFCAAFTTLFFASVPDHFALGALTLAIALWLFTDRLAGGPVRWLAWSSAGWFATSITVTNLLPLVALFLLANWRRMGPGRALAGAGALMVLSVATAYGSAVLLNLGYGIHGVEVLMPNEGTGPHKAAPLAELASFPLRVLQSFAPGTYDVLPNALSLREPHHYAVQFEFGTTRTPGVAGWLLAGLLAFTVALRWRRGGTDRTMLLGLAGAVLFHGVLHARLGTDYFLYSFHWAEPLVLLLMLPERGHSPAQTQAAAARPVWRRLHAGLLAALVIALALNSGAVLRAVDADLARHWRPWTEADGTPATGPAPETRP